MKKPSKTIRLLALLVFITATVNADTLSTAGFASLQEIKKSVTAPGSTLIAYDITGGVWVKDQPLLVNRDFDFSMAMALKDIGPAIAAGNRKKGNETIVKLLQKMRPVNLNTIFKNSIRDKTTLNKKKLKPVRIALYAILYGHPKAHLRVIMEVVPLHDKSRNKKSMPARYIHISGWHAVTGKNSWCANNGKKIRIFFTKAVPVLVNMWQQYVPVKQDRKAIKMINITGGKVQQKHTGWVLASNSQRTLFQSREMPGTIVSCFRRNITIKKHDRISGKQFGQKEVNVKKH